MNWIWFADAVTGAKASVKFPDCFPRLIWPFSWLFEPSLISLESPLLPDIAVTLWKRISRGVHCRGIRQSAYNSPPRLRINQHWCKTIKPMRYNYLFILITQSGAVWIALSKRITRRWLRTQTAPAISVSLCVCCVWVQRRSGSPLKQPLERYPITLGPFPLPSILFCPLTSSGHHRQNESCWWRIWGNGMDGWMTGPTASTEPPAGRYIRLHTWLYTS